MSDDLNANELYDALEGQLVKEDVVRIKGLLYNSPLGPNVLERCDTSFSAICRELAKEKKIVPEDLDFRFLEKLFETTKMLLLKDMVTKFVADAKSRRRTNEASEHTVNEHGVPAKDVDYADPDQYRNDGRSHYGSSGQSTQADPSQPQGSSSGNPQPSGGAQSQGSSTQTGGVTGVGNFPTIQTSSLTINQNIYGSPTNQAGGNQPQ